MNKHQSFSRNLTPELWDVGKPVDVIISDEYIKRCKLFYDRERSNWLAMDDYGWSHTLSGLSWRYV